jgi:hypothetical protein
LARKRASPTLAPGFGRIPGPLRHYRKLATGEELSRRQYQQEARGYLYEKTAKGKARARARRSIQSSWVDFLRKRFETFVGMTRSAIVREMRRLGFLFPHHGAKRRPTLSEKARQEAFLGFIGREPAVTRQYYPTLVEGTDEAAARSAEY